MLSVRMIEPFEGFSPKVTVFQVPRAPSVKAPASPSSSTYPSKSKAYVPGLGLLRKC